MAVQATVTPKTIVLEGDLHKYHGEAPADAALKPGHLIKRNSDGEVLKVATAALKCAIWVAKENELEGGLITTAYAAADPVPYHKAQPGDLLYMRVAASATALVVGDPVTPSNDGTVKKWNGTTDWPLGECEVALDNSGGGSEAMVQIRIW